MSGTVMRARKKPGNRHAVVAGVIVDRSTTYSADAHDPATEDLYGRFRALLEDDPEWTDGEWVSFLAATA